MCTYVEVYYYTVTVGLFTHIPQYIFREGIDIKRILSAPRESKIVETFYQHALKNCLNMSTGTPYDKGKNSLL